MRRTHSNRQIRLNPHNHGHTPSPNSETKRLRPRPLWAAVAGAVLLLALTSACRLAPNEETMNRQARALPWPFGPSVSDGVYSPTIVEDVYSTE
ncbi:hypothetical protein MJ257_11460 [Paenibacillus timonensis]|uniref:Uncharacterized protein n=1 Tax=Paenibacillus timonensis TaxID=225915 RepID=A0ABW3S6A2_9BACL|nr:hypothetical protein [Paenibacillus sp.]MCH1640729.1 hypothetical protein [Paenibacillus timonensis]MDU2243504.1 hypothetical protein [Paenibacillus sp.]